jgi:hypothetical protein
MDNCWLRIVGRLAALHACLGSRVSLHVQIAEDVVQHKVAFLLGSQEEALNEIPLIV